MSILHLVRHGQASFGADDYDNLSPTGIQQSIELGKALAKQQSKPSFCKTLGCIS